MPEFSFTNLTVMLKKKITQTFSLYRHWWKSISLGLYLRFLTLFLSIYVASINPLFPDINDMNELITQAWFFIFQGKCPYNQVYTLTVTLHVGTLPLEIYQQDFLNYGPVNLLLHLPAMIYPASFYGAGVMDLQWSFMFLHWFFDFLIFDRLMRMGSIQGARVLWMIPVMVPLSITTHMSVVLFLILMGYEKWDNPVQSIFWLSLAALAYQYAAFLLLFAIAYHLRQYPKQVFQGLVPGLILLGVFQLWATVEGRPMALVNDLFIEQLNRPYDPWERLGVFWLPWACSVPALVVNLSGTDFITDWTGGLLRLSTVIFLIALVVIIILLVWTFLREDYKQSLLFSVIGMGLVLLGSPSGAFHHTLMLIFPMVFMIKAYYPTW